AEAEAHELHIQELYQRLDNQVSEKLDLFHSYTHNIQRNLVEASTAEYVDAWEDELNYDEE
ncbi:MAG: hypothetical protein Q9224_007740, partial [Gallowayella concinna]